MINNKLAMQECIKTNAVILYTDRHDRQWVGNGRSFYELRGLPKLTPDQVLSMMGVGEKAAAKILMEERELPEAIDTDGLRNADERIDLPDWTVEIDGEHFHIIRVGNIMAGLAVREMKPCIDKDGQTVPVLRRTEDGVPYICMMDGFDCIAVLSPITMRRMSEEIRRVAQEIVVYGFAGGSHESD